MSSVVRCECSSCSTTNYTCVTDGLCYTDQHLDNTGAVYYIRNCLNRDRFLPPNDVPFDCRDDTSPNIVCCFTDMCNKDLIPTVLTPELKTGGGWGPYETALVSLCPVFLLFVFFAVLFIRYMRRRKDSLRKDELDSENMIPLMDPSIKDMINGTTSGSGAGLPLLVQRSVARTIPLSECVGKGRYGEVWKGLYHGDTVAVKVFSSRDERSWFREVEIYQTVMLNHDNVLSFIAADNKDNGTWTQLWLITQFHPNGSLFDYLNQSTVDNATMYMMAFSIANGLAHLHMEIVGTKGKPAIAHRDLKSKNILVKNDGQCAIADLGLAVRYDSTSQTVDIPPNPRVGTVRYLAPEVLDGSINLNVFENCKRADVYACGLVFWELARRCNVDGIYEAYQLPYYETDLIDPTIDEMRKVVCDAKQRPSCPNRWQSYENLRVISKIMKECWYANSAARLTALRIKKTIAALGAQKDLKI